MKTIPFTIQGCKANNNEAVTRHGRKAIGKRHVVTCEHCLNVIEAVEDHLGK